MKGYTLVSALVATVLLLGAILPLLTIQGRLHRQAIAASQANMLLELTTDFQKLKQQTQPRSNAWKTERYQIKRDIRRLGPSLFQVHYQVALRDRPGTRWELFRVWFRR